MKLGRCLVAYLGIVTFLGSCTFASRNLKELEYPGFVDVGAGYAVAFDTRSSEDDDADGLLVSLKAYPFGRWYSKPKSTTAVALGEASERLVREKENKAAVEDVRKELRSAATQKNPKDCSTCLDRAQTKADNILDAGLRQSALEAVEEARTSLRKAPADQATTALRAETVQVLESKEKELAAQAEKVASVDADFLRNLITARDEILRDEFYEVVRSADEHWSWRLLRRFSVFYGTSANNFSGGGLDSSVNAVGIGFDIAPQLAILYGRGFYEVDDGAGGSDTDSGAIFSISLNLNAFKGLLAAATE